MSPTNPTEPGWYPDPWGTGGERRYDGTAWGRETRPAAGTPAPTVAPGPTPAGATATSGPATAPTGDLPPAAWYPDPAGSPGLRYWDGTAWTAHTAYTDGPSAVAATRTVAPRPDLDGARLFATERRLAGWLRLLLPVAGIALAAYLMIAEITMYAIGPGWRREMRRFFRDTSGSPKPPTLRIPDSLVQDLRVLQRISDVSLLVLVVVGVVFIIWLGTAGKVALAEGRLPRRAPWLGAWSFAIPILHLWWPYIATRDLLDREDPERRFVGRWWALWIAASVVQVAVGVAILLGLPMLAATIATIIVGLTALAAAFAAVRVVGAVGRSHAELVGASAQS